jgi:hypothetical protein
VFGFRNLHAAVVTPEQALTIEPKLFGLDLWSETEREKLHETFAPPIQISDAPVAPSTTAALSESERRAHLGVGVFAAIM